MEQNHSSFIVTRHTTLDSLITHIKQAHQVKSNYLSKDQFCIINYRQSNTGSWIVINQEKSLKLAITSVKDEEDIFVARRMVVMALIALGFKVKG